MTDDRFEEFVRRTMADVPPVPREEMWSRIEQARRFRRPRETRRQWLIGAAALAAMLILGIALGRISMARQTPGAQPQVAQTEVTSSSTAQPPSRSAAQPPSRAAAQPLNRSAVPQAYTVAALEHMSRAEVLLTAVSSGTVDQQLIGWAKDMLTSTQMLLDSPAASDPRIAHMLEDLELVLAQIAAASAGRTQSDLDLIHHGMKETDVLPRLRATASANRGRPVGT